MSKTCTSPGRIWSSLKWDPYGCVHFITSASCHEMHDTVYSEAKLNSRGELRCHMAAVAINGLKVNSNGKFLHDFIA